VSLTALHRILRKEHVTHHFWEQLIAFLATHHVWIENGSPRSFLTAYPACFPQPAEPGDPVAFASAEVHGAVRWFGDQEGGFALQGVGAVEKKLQEGTVF
jgi:hypothetical protein